MQILFDWAKSLPNAWGDALNKIPLLLEVLLNTIIGYLWVLACHPGQHFHQAGPYLDLIIEPFLFFHWFANEAVDVAAYADHAYSHPFEVLLRPCYITQ